MYNISQFDCRNLHSRISRILFRYNRFQIKSGDVREANPQTRQISQPTSSDIGNLSMFKALSTLLAMVIAIGSTQSTDAQTAISPDVVYGHKHGLAMTFDVFTPQETANGAAVLFMVSGGWYSTWSPPEQMQWMAKPLTDKGFTVFAVRHGSSPKFSIPEAVADVRRSVRFIRLNAEKFKVDPNRIGVFGMSAGGHLSLMLGTASDEGNPKAKDPVDRVSDRVNAVVAYVAPTDLRIMVSENPKRLAAYERFPALTLDMKNAEAGSPLVHVTSDDAPTLLLAGDKDELVPISHSRNIQAAFEKAQVQSKLIEFKGAGHGFQGEDAKQATESMVGWFEKHLAAESKIDMTDMPGASHSQEATQTEPTTVRMTPNVENVVASELFGEWIADNELSKRLGGSSDHAGQGPIVFRKNDQAEQRMINYLAKIVAKIREDKSKPETLDFLKAFQDVYLAGEVEFQNKKQDFALLSIFGTPRLLIYDRKDDLESENVMLARDETGDNDLLFLGGDYNNQSFGAFKRVPEKASDSDQ